ncbi:TMV resistance protein N-like [Bidens hawaiensis]|uniref:TMV resistance protein N-like n=1 Tax=Bidens hawaiensis TaxID=980011 RepID=UPI00404A7991
MKELQKQVLKDVLNDINIDVTSASHGKNMLKRMMPSRKALIVLDGVDDINDLEHEEAICLFSRYAFNRDIPNQGYEELSRKVIRYGAGLPLTIKVLGSHLCGRSECEWVDALERLKTVPEDQTLKILELSYNGLENDHKEIFLDVVCILKGQMKHDAIRILGGCGFNALIGLSVLEQKYLITISDIHGLGFHDHIEEMGWNIVRRLHPNEPSRHSRLWIKEEIEKIFLNKSGTEATRSIRLRLTNIDPTIIVNGLRNMNGLRLLYVHGKFGKRSWKDNTTSIYLPDALESLIPQSQEVRERKFLNKLRFLDLSYSRLTTFDLGMTPHLEVLNLQSSWGFEEFQFPIECPNLKVLNLSYTKFHKEHGSANLDSVGTFNIDVDFTDVCPLHPKNNFPMFRFRCKYDEPRSSPSGNLEKLISFGPCVCENLKCILATICGLQHLRELSLGRRVPQDLWRLERLELLHLSEQQFQHLPDSICTLKHLQSLELGSCLALEQLPENIHELECLESLRISCCKSLRDIPNNICKMKCLKSLKLRLCDNIKKLPEELGSLECLKVLDITGTRISHLPQSIYQLKGLCIHGSRKQLESYGFTSFPEEVSIYTHVEL